MHFDASPRLFVVRALGPMGLGLLGLSLGFTPATAQTSLYAPGGTVGTSSNSFVGVGTSSPRMALDVIGGVAQTYGGANQFYQSAGNEYWRIYPAYSDGNFYLTRGAQNPSGGALDLFRFRGTGTLDILSGGLTTTGNVGIGVANPGARLTIYGSAPQTPSLVVDRAYDGARTQFLYGGYPTAGEVGMTYYGSGTIALWIGANLNSTGSSHASPLQAVATSPSWLSSYDTANDVYDIKRLAPGGTSSTFLRITNSGNVGIGTTSPAYSLHSAGDIGVAGDKTFNARYNGSESYKASFGWSHLQLGNNGPNWIVAGRTQAGASLTFVVNNTADYAYGAYNGISAMHIAAGGNVGIGTLSPSHKLAVNGTIKAREVIVDLTGWSDYVLAEDYRLAPLSEVEAHIKAKKHLPGIPSTAEVEQGGVSLGDMQARLLAKVEELTLHVIRLDREVQDLRADNVRLRSATNSNSP